MNDLIAAVVVRAYALLAPATRSTDATLAGAAAILREPEVRAAILKAGRDRSTASEVLMQRNEARVSADVANLDVAALKQYRDWMLAHVTMNPRPRVTHLEVWETADAVLLATDHLWQGRPRRI